MVVAQLERSLEWELLSAAERPRLRVFCPVWQEQPANGEPWWMTFNNQTYSGDLLAVLNGENVFGGRERRYPLLADLGQAQPEDAGGRDTRFPRVTRAEVLASAPDLILLPDEPYAYGEDDIAAARGWFDQTPASQTGRIALVDGSLLTWHGTRLAEALAILPTLFTEKP
jgi:ABC-type Fe3+-hydroxamate transport system substrate-binding protein